MASWIWNTDHEVNAEVKRALSNYPQVFLTEHESNSQTRKFQAMSNICTSCTRALNFLTKGATWAKTKNSFSNSTRTNGCHMCIILAHAFDKTSIMRFARMGLDGVLELHFNYRTAERDPSGKLDWEQRTHMPISNITLERHVPDEVWLRISPEKTSSLNSLNIQLRMRPLQNSSLSYLMETMPAQHMSTGNKQNLRLAAMWLRACKEHHPMCRAFAVQTPHWRPTRLIQVGSATQGPRLVISNDNIGSVSYTALSYCWGSRKNVVLTKDKIADYREALPLGELPATIRDAIHVTKELGYKFIWIDALCIIQDCPQDWERESKQMADVYGSAVVTLCAAGNSTVTDSMFCNRDPRTIRPCVVKAGISLDPMESRLTDDDGRWAIYPTQSERMVATAMNNNSLCQRAWTLQERFLSPRTLFFGDKQILWSCVTTEASETFPGGMDPDFSTPLDEAKSLTKLRQRFMKLSAGDELPSAFWNDIVGMYTKAALTVSSDKLVALQGIAQRMAGKSSIDARSLKDQSKSDYAAGIWKDGQFLQNLLWSSRIRSTRVRPSRYRAPSWSWASIDGEIEPFERYVFWAWNQREAKLASVKEISTQSSPSDLASLTGQVIDGHIDLECYLRPCHLSRVRASSRSDAIIVSGEPWYDGWTTQPTSARAAAAISRADEKLTIFTESCTLDCPKEIPSADWLPVFCVPLQLASIETDRYEQATWETYQGLVLLCTDDEDCLDATYAGELCNGRRGNTLKQPAFRTFRRLGTFSFHINHQERDAQQDVLFGPLVMNKAGVRYREKATIRMV